MSPLGFSSRDGQGRVEPSRGAGRRVFSCGHCEAPNSCRSSGPLDDIVIVALAFRYAARQIKQSCSMTCGQPIQTVLRRLLGIRRPDVGSELRRRVGPYANVPPRQSPGRILCGPESIRIRNQEGHGTLTHHHANARICHHSTSVGPEDLQHFYSEPPVAGRSAWYCPDGSARLWAARCIVRYQPDDPVDSLNVEAAPNTRKMAVWAHSIGRAGLGEAIRPSASAAVRSLASMKCR